MMQDEVKDDITSGLHYIARSVLEVSYDATQSKEWHGSGDYENNSK